MSLDIPKTSDLNAAIIAQLEGAFGQTIPVFAKAFLRVLAKVLAGFITITYKFGGSIFLQMFVQYATDTEVTINGKRLVPLTEWGRLVGVGDPNPATQSEMTIQVVINNPTGTLVANTAYFNEDNGFTYLTQSDVALVGSSVSVDIKAASGPDTVNGKGAAGNLQVGRDTVSLITPDSRVETVSLVTALNVDAVDAETTDSYRSRIITLFRNQPQGGALIDYVVWGIEPTGIVNIYPYTGDPGIVNVYSEAEITPTNPDGIPSGAQLTEVFEAIEQDDAGLASRRPTNAFVNSYAITRSAYNVSVVRLNATGSSATLAELRTKIEETLTTYFLSREPYINGVATGRRKDRITESAIRGVVQDTVDAYDASFETIIVDKVGGASGIYTDSLGEGEKAKLGTVIWL